MCVASWLVCATARSEIDVDRGDRYQRDDKKTDNVAKNVIKTVRAASLPSTYLCRLVSCYVLLFIAYLTNTRIVPGV